MSANINTSHDTPPRVLIVAANPSTSSVTGWPVGFWWSELTHPYWAFVEAGYDVEIRSPDGGPLQGDGYSDPEDASQYSAHDLISLGFKKSPAHRALLEETPSLDGVDPADYDAVFFVGGQSPMFTFRGDAQVQQTLADFWEAGKVCAVVCHATCLLLETRLSNGDLLAAGKTWTGFANSEERFADELVGQRLQPFWIEDEARALEQTNFITGKRFEPFAVRDGRLVTGQQQYSGTAAAELVIEAIGR